jgi:AAA family ATP:ADP antiporter
LLGVLRRLGIEIRPGEVRLAFLLFLCFFLFTTFQYTAKSVRQSTFIEELGSTKLPYVYLLVALLSYPLLRLYAGFVDRSRRHALIETTILIVVANLVVFWWLFQYPWRWVPVAFYVWTSIVFVMMVSQLWSYANHVLDARQARRLFGLIGAAGPLGTVLGGQVARLAKSTVDTRSVLLIAAAILTLVVVGIHAVHRAAPAESRSSSGAAGLGKLDQARGGFQIIRESRLLQLIGVVLFLCVMTAQVVDVQFNWAVEAGTTDVDDRTARFGGFYSIMGISAFLFQLIFTSRIHRTLGVGFAMRVFPLTMALGTGGLLLSAAFFPLQAQFAVAKALKIGENGMRYSLDQSTRELLFLPVPTRHRAKAKAFIDVFLQRAAKGFAALLLLPVALGVMTAVQAGWISLALIALWLAAAGFAYREYVATFRRSLERGTVDTEVPVNVSDVTTLELLVQSLGSADSRQVLYSLEILSSNDRGKLVPPLLLYHDDAEVRLRTLTVLSEAGRRDAASLIERLLGDDHPEVRAEAIRVLAEFQGRDACSLMLPRLDEPVPGVRAAAVACVANHGDPEMVARANDALSEMLFDSDPDVRAEAAKAMGAIQEPGFRAELLQLLYDPDAGVAREALAAVRRRVPRDGLALEYAPTVVALLQNRHLKHDAREALVALGAPAVPILSHFMNESQEALWVRRALPKTIAGIGGEAAWQALLDALGKPRDAFQRRKIIEALGSVRDQVGNTAGRRRLEREIRNEARRYLRTVWEIASLDIREVARFVSPSFRWSWERREPSLVERLLAERMDDHVRNIFGLLALLYPPDDVWAAHRGLMGEHAGTRAHALEYLDNTLTGELKTDVFAAIDDAPLGTKLQRARRMLGLSRGSKVETLRSILEAAEGDDPGARDLGVAGVYAVYLERVSDLFPLVADLSDRAEDPMLRETAGWVASRLNR